MPFVRHINLANSDGQIYCCLRNRVVKLDDAQMTTFCHGCKMFDGTAQGKGVVCCWNDARSVKDPHVAVDPLLEFKQNQLKQIVRGTLLLSV
ncbi:hypothetical protein [Paenibacillus sp. y28]|uniref:hypothetical protein n=1 Tax=Paenibacillus sp. y28 TaxID=3129110 RepID=UPI00301714D1